MEINIENCQTLFEVGFENEIEDIVKYVLEHEEVNVDYEVNVFLVDNEKIKEINFEHRGIDRPTDCLSFPMLSYHNGKIFKQEYKEYIFKDYELDDGKLILGDVIISLEKAKEQSLEFNHSFYREVKYLLIHSLLHLMGYDHMIEQDKRIMRECEKSILKNLGIFR